MTDGRGDMQHGDGEPLSMPPHVSDDDDMLMTPADIAEVMRMDEALARLEAGGTLDLDRREDPALVALLDTAGGIRHALGDTTETQAFHSFHQRSRAALLHQLEVDARPETVIMWRRGRLLTGLGAAAASIALFGFTLGGGTLPIDADPTTPNLTVARSESELTRLSQTINDIQQRTALGQTVPAPLLHSVVENAASLASAIESNPTRFERSDVVAFAQAVQASAVVLEAATPEEGAQGALTAAQRAARDGVVVATRFLDADPTATATPEATETPAATATATPEATPAASATPSSTPEPSSTPAATSTASPTATPAPTSGTPDGTVRP
ncbi:MAG: hypothetical protein Q8M79_10110 [Dehalococcoidia bacterium]|nr:hypothetical protein [Dehalococcoidia bacterium]